MLLAPGQIRYLYLNCGVVALKVIFLDIDGVLNSEKYIRRCGRYGVVIDPTRMVLLKQIVDQTNAKIVLSSSWREHWSKDAKASDSVGKELDAVFNKYGLTIFDKTDEFSRREVEIEAWLMMHPKTLAFVVLDDRFLDSPVLRGHVVKTSNYVDGLDEAGVQKAINILNS